MLSQAATSAASHRNHPHKTDAWLAKVIASQIPAFPSVTLCEQLPTSPSLHPDIVSKDGSFAPCLKKGESNILLSIREN